MEYLLNKIKNAEVVREPYDHIVIDNLLPQDVYSELAEGLEGVDMNNFQLGHYGGSSRLPVDITDYSSQSIHSHNYNTLKDKKYYKVKSFVDGLLGSKQELYSLLGDKLPTDRFDNDNFFHISMVKDTSNYEIKPHTDLSINIFTVLFYTPKTNANEDSAALNIFEEGGEDSIQTDAGEVRNLKLVKRVGFAPNRMILFAPSSKTWHGVSFLDNLVGTRNSFQMFFYRK